MHRIRRLVVPLAFGAAFAFAGALAGPDGLYFRSAVCLFATLYWGVLPGLLSTVIFLVPAFLDPDATPLRLMALAGTVPAVVVTASVAAARKARSALLFRVVGAFLLALLVFVYVFYLRRQSWQLFMPLCLALFCFLYYYLRVSRLRTLMVAGLWGLAASYVCMLALPFLQGARGFGPLSQPFADIAEFLSLLMPADLLTALITAALVPALRKTFGREAVEEEGMS